MFLIILGVILLALGAAVVAKNDQSRRFAPIVRGVAIVMILLGVATSCFKQIDAGQVGVKTLFGKVEEDVLTSGLNFVNPLVVVRVIDIKTQNYTMSGI